MNTSIQKTRSYYQQLGNLMWELSHHSRFFNLGFCEKKQKKIKPIEAQKQLVRQVAELGHFQKGMHILDVGCGLGGPAHMVFMEHDCMVFGIDPGRYQIEQAAPWLREQTSPNKLFIHYGDAMNLPYANNSFHGMYSIESAFHYPDKAQFIKEAARTLKQNGILVVADILRLPDKKDTWFSRALGQGLSAETFYTVDLYKKAALQDGLKVIQDWDISGNVARAFPIWTRSLIHQYNNLKKTYRFMTLFKIGMALWLAPILSPLTQFRYYIMVFQKK
jgi:ubiquinone/menaquinone biosynthesis C-methylase UbiE